MASLAVCTAADVIQRAGGTTAVIQLIPSGLDPSTYDTSLMATLIGDASEEWAAYANVQVQVYAWKLAIDADPTLSWPGLAVDCVAWWTVPKVWVAGGQGQAMPPHIVTERARIDAICERYRRNEISLGAPPQYPALQPNVQTIDLDPNQNRMTLAGFQRWIA